MRRQRALRRARSPARRRRTGRSTRPCSGRRWSWRRLRWRREGRRPGFRPAPVPPRAAARWRCRPGACCPPRSGRPGRRRLPAGGTNPADSTPMSPPAGRPGWARVTTCPAGSTAYTRPLVSSGAMRSPPNRPNAAGATVIPPSMAGAPAAMTRQQAVTADAEHGGPAAGPGGDQQPVPEPPGAVERDPGQASGPAAGWRTAAPGPAG